MHVTPIELRALRRDGILIRFALLDSMAFVLAEIPATGSGGTSLETPCTRPHWGFVISGELEFETDGRRRAIPAGSAFHVGAGGLPHRFHAGGPARVAGFEPVDPIVDTSHAALAAQGFERLEPDGATAATVIPPSFSTLIDPNRIEKRAWAMSSLVLTQARFGPASGATANWCDAPHWGLVTGGRLAIEFEDGIEILGTGDVYHCPAGPPGHRIEAAEPASIVDLTPIDVLAGPGRISLWRRGPSERLHPGEAGEIAVVSLG